MSASTLLAAPAPLETARAHHARSELLMAAQAYRQTLEVNPKSRDALLGLSLIARQSNQLLAALRMAQAALAAAADSGSAAAVAWANYGDTLLTLNQFPATLATAQAAFRRALAHDPQIAVAHYGLGNTLALQSGNFAAALASFQTAASLAPNIPEFHFALAFTLGKLGQHAQAVSAYRRAVTLRPGFASAWLNLGVELIADGRDNLAYFCYRQAVAASPAGPPDIANTRISAHLNLGHLHRSRRHFPQARESYNQALALAPPKHPRHAEVQVVFTYLHLEQQDFPQAWHSLEAAEAAQIQNDPTHPNPEIPNARGILLLAEDSAQPQARVPQVPNLRPGIIDAAITAFQQAEIQGHKTAPSNRGNALLRLGRIDEALLAQQTALALDPHHPGIRYNLALTQLRAGDFAQGWPNYEIRWQFREVHPRPRRFRQPRWQGEPLDPSDCLFLYAEQGLGDTIQFCRYLALVAQRLSNNLGAPHLDSEMRDRPANPIHLILEVQPPLTRLLADLKMPCRRERLCHPEEPCHPERSEGPASALSHPAITAQILAHGDPLPPFTHHCPLMSLPSVFETTLDAIPTNIPYLRPSPKSAQLDPRLGTELGAPSWMRPLHPGWEAKISALKIGLHWAGNPNYRADRERSTALQTFLPLFQIPQIQWVSLQKGPTAGQIHEILPDLLSSPPVPGFSFHDACSQDADLADTAAVLANLDLVITTDSAVAHLAGALGKPLWLLLPWQSDWRWMQETLVTPWYPSARLFRQSSPNNWPELIHRVAGELRKHLENTPSSASS